MEKVNGTIKIVTFNGQTSIFNSGGPPIEQFKVIQNGIEQLCKNVGYDPEIALYQMIENIKKNKG